MGIKKICNCGKVIEIAEGKCSSCMNKAKARHKLYDSTTRDEESTTFYHSDEWKKTRRDIINHYNGLDIYLYYTEKKIAYATTVHHIIEAKEDMSKRLVLNNLIPVTDGTHSKIHQLYKVDKSTTQRLLKELLTRFENEFKGAGV